MGRVELETKISEFCKQAGIKKKDFAEIFGLSAPTRLYEIFSSEQNYHINHFALLQATQENTGKTGQDFIDYIKDINDKIRIALFSVTQ